MRGITSRRPMSRSLSVGLVIAACAGIAGCGGTAKRIAGSELGVTTVDTTTTESPALSADKKAIYKIGDDSQAFNGVLNKLEQPAINRDAGSAAKLAAQAPHLVSISNDWAREWSGLRHQKLKAALRPLVIDTQKEAADVNSIASDLSRGDQSYSDVMQLGRDMNRAYRDVHIARVATTAAIKGLQ